VIATRDATLHIAQELQSVHDMVLAGTYNSQVNKTISYSKYVDEEMNSTSPVKRRKDVVAKRGVARTVGAKRRVWSATVGACVMGTVITLVFKTWSNKRKRYLE
jgi:hypothetical protein